MEKHYDELETRDPQTRERDLIRGVAKLVAHAKKHSPAAAEKFADVEPAALTSPSSIAALPLTRKSELAQLQKSSAPFGGLAAYDKKELHYLFASPGQIYEPATRRENYWRFARALFAAGFRAGDTVHNCFSYHLTPAGMFGDSGCHALGCAVIPAGTGNTELQVQTIAHLTPDGYLGTPSFLKIILETADEMNADVSCITKALVSGEALPPSLRAQFTARGIATVQAYATADVGLIAYEFAGDVHDGAHHGAAGLIIDEEAYVEIVRPGSGETVADGEVGEVVVTALNPDYPLIRLATGDLSAIIPAAGDHTNRRLKGWLGRADQTAKVRGMFIHPSQVGEILTRHHEILRARLVITWQNERDEMTLHCETKTQISTTVIANTIRQICKLRAAVKLLPPKTLPNDGVVIEDARKY